MCQLQNTFGAWTPLEPSMRAYSALPRLLTKFGKTKKTGKNKKAGKK